VRTRERPRGRRTHSIPRLTTLSSLGRCTTFAAWVAGVALCVSPAAARAQAAGVVQGAGSAQFAALDTTGVMLSPGDILRITVWRQPELSGEFVIGANGNILHPLYREVRVTSLPLSAVEDRVRTFLARYESNPEFVMLPILRIIVGGEVRQPNVYTVPVGTSVAAAIAGAGGPTERGKLEQVRLQRGASAQVIDLTSLDQRATRITIRSGDQILVGRRRNFVQDVLSPLSSVIAAGAALTTVFIQLHNNR
jgi:polysaccharide export outer membrane protein